MIQPYSGVLAAFVLFSSPVFAQAPPNYYNTVDDTNATTLRSTLHQVIDDHQRFPYSSGGTDTVDILELAQTDPSNSSRILDVYKNASYTKQGSSNSNYNREHAWPKSYGFPDDGGTNYPYTDCHMLQLCDSNYNSSRSNKPYKTCNSSCTEQATFSNGGQGGGSGTYLGNSNWTSGNFTTGTWEVWIGRRGDIARAMFYADLRYEGGNHNVTNASEPDLRLTNSTSLISSTQTGSNESIAYMGLLDVLLQWHLDDPVDAFEVTRNNIVQSFQGNRNPFVDHPEWVGCIYSNNCSPAPNLQEYCFGDGGDQMGCRPCPCGNEAPIGTVGGCLNSSGGSARLISSGTPSQSNDTQRFEVTGANVLTFALLQSGDNKLPLMGICPPGTGLSTAILDGLRCMGGNNIRHGGRASDAQGDIGVTNLGWGGVDPPSVGIMQQGGFGVGQVRQFQVFYREFGAQVCATGLNSSSAIEVTFLP